MLSSFIQVVCDANELEKEADPGAFFGSYSQINNSLEQMFIDLLLLMDGCASDVVHEERTVIDLSGVTEALKAVTIRRLDGMCMT